MKLTLTKWLFGALTLTTITMTGCTKKPHATNNEDPFESYNRVMFAFNGFVDVAIIRPVTTVYSVITPAPFQAGLTNAFHNIHEITTFPNDFLQGNFKYMAVDFWRFIINSTFGVVGFFDVATRWGIQPHVEGFGLTLAKWRGGKSSPYFIIPILGPSTIQNGIGLGADYFTTPWPYIKNNTINYAVTGLELVHVRARYLPADKVIETAFDPYVFVRDAYLQKTKNRISENETLGKKPQ